MTSTREILGIAYCPTCEQDTLPVAGICLWCDTVIADATDDPQANTPPRALEDECELCLTPLTGLQSRYCSRKCQQTYWMKHTEKGRAWVKGRDRARTERRRAQRAALKAAA